MTTIIDKTVAAGRYAFQADAERLIAPDVIEKLELSAGHTFLEIGCGPGLLLSAAERVGAICTGIDIESQIDIAKETTSARLIAGHFEKVELAERFDRMLIYSVIHCLPDFEAVKMFVAKAAALLAPQGRMLIGDIPNSDTKKAFLDSEVGAAFHADWLASNHSPPVVNEHSGVGSFTTAEIHSLMMDWRARGMLAYLLPQPASLPFGHTREDLLIVRL
jgi:cyclopropane fatty-acyl-phospholipid synthase-like methyltransferase